MASKMATQRKTTLENDVVAVSVDSLGRITSLRNKLTKTELVAYPREAEAWRIILATGRHTIAVVCASQQTPARIERERQGGAESLALCYDSLRMGKTRLAVSAQFTLTLKEDSPDILARVQVNNESALRVDEIEFPIIRGLGGFRSRGARRTLNMVMGHDRGWNRGLFQDDVLGRGLPDSGRPSNHYCRGPETAMYACGGYVGLAGRPGDQDAIWCDLWCERQGLYVGFHPERLQLFALKFEKFPKEVPNGPGHLYPKQTPRWLSVHAVHTPQIKPHARWRSEPVVVMPHTGDWHVGADRYVDYRRRWLSFCKPPAWVDDIVGWTEILGKTYLGEVFHDYAHCAEAVVKDAKVTGINFVFYYGHTSIGAEGADFDNGPADDMGGKKGFRRMVETLHANGIRIMLLDHLHRWINRDLPQYKKLRLERYAVLSESGEPVTARWWKETALSCIHLAGPTPEWIEMCPSCDGWLRIYLDHVTKMVDLGVDGLELDTFCPSPCHSPNHGHAPGADMFWAKIEFMRAVRDHAKRLNPDFALFGETMVPETREVLDGFYPFRFLDENGRIYCYLYPELRQQTVLVGNYAYDQVNKALQLGLGVDTEIWGLRKTTLAACPELARYIGEVNRFRRKHPETLIRGTFRDTVGARVRGDVFYSVLTGTDGSRALVLRNPHKRRVSAAAMLDGTRGRLLTLWRPGQKERRVTRVPLSVTLAPHGLAVLLAVPR